MTSKPSLQNRLKSVRSRLGVSQQELADSAGVARQTIGGVEAGTYALSLSVALKISAALGCRVEELFWLDDERPVIEARKAEHGEWRGAGDKVTLAFVGGKWIAHALNGNAALRAELIPADGIANNSSRRNHVAVTTLDEPGSLSNSVSVAGCTPALSLWARSAERWHPGMRVQWIHANSTDSLASLGRGEIHAAGMHLRDAASGEFNLPQVRKAFPKESINLVNLGVWEEGFVVAAGNPKAINAAEDLVRRDVSVANREHGAGSRQLLDELVESIGAKAGDVLGYENTTMSHYECARAIRSGIADVGVGVRSVAEAFGLSFVPLGEVRYDLAVLSSSLDEAPVRNLFETLDHRWVRTQMQIVGGYDTSRMGQTIATT